MSDPISGASAGASGADFVYQRGPAQQESDASAFLSIMDRGLDRISQRPELEPESDRLVEGLSGSYAGEVGDAKKDIVGGDVGRAERASQSGSESLEDRMRNIYTELTHYQVAWRIAQNVQRDVSQLLRGS